MGPVGYYIAVAPPGDKPHSGALETDARSPGDGELLRRLRLREPAALAELAERYGAALVRTACLHLGNGHAAEDLAQETLLAAWDGARRVAEGSNLRPWLMGILLNQCRKYRRSWWRRLRRQWTAAQRRTARAADAPSEEELESLREALARLDEKLRSVVILRFLEGFSVAQTAEALRIPEGTVKSRTHAALRELKCLLRRNHDP